MPGCERQIWEGSNATVVSMLLPPLPTLRLDWYDVLDRWDAVGLRGTLGLWEGGGSTAGAGTGWALLAVHPRAPIRRSDRLRSLISMLTPRGRRANENLERFPNAAIGKTSHPCHPSCFGGSLYAYLRRPQDGERI